MRECVKCGEPRRADSRFCYGHYHETVRGMRSSKYLTFIPSEVRRPRSAWENIYETKFGVLA
jgi:hypothetical protein